MRHPPAMFVGDAAGLDFLNSVATPVDTPIDWIANGDGFLNWLAQAKLVPDDVLEDMRARALPGELDRVADQARSLREWFRGFIQRYKGRALPSTALAELEPVNNLLDRGESYSRIVAAPDGPHPFTLASHHRWRHPEALLFPIGEALAQLVCTEPFTNVKACEGPACTLLFADHTKGHGRRWCSMAVCGNRAKQAAHRNRLRNAHHP